MTLTLSIPKTQQEELVIPVPSFYRNMAQTNYERFEYIAVLDENTVVRVTLWDKYVSITNGEMDVMKNSTLTELGRKTYGLDYQPVTEEEFLSIYEEALEHARLTPRLTTYLDDLKTIGVNRKEI